jgi:diguanylate cyclase (GGDEF)-like protein
MSAAMQAAIDNPAERELKRLEALARYDILDTPAEPAFDRIASLIRLIFGVETSVVSMIDAHRQWYKAAEGTAAMEVPVGQTFCRHTIQGTGPLVVPDATLDDRFSANPHVTAPHGVRFYAGMPLTTSDGHNIGSICAIDSTPRQFSARETAILRELADMVMHELELRRLATTDPLTGISSRRAFREDADKYIALARRHRSQVSALAVDIDRFKSINDTYGHAAGDQVLKAVAGCLAAELRQSDVLGRMGGEEFGIILPDANAEAALAVAEKLRHAIAKLTFPGSRPPIRVTASFGIAALDPGADDLDSVMVKADEALYEAKAGGRNMSVIWRGATSATMRQVDRRRVLKAGRLVFNNGSSVMDCTVRALWETGAEAQLFSTTDLPDELTLEIRSSGFRWNARVTERRPNAVVLEFV